MVFVICVVLVCWCFLLAGFLIWVFLRLGYFLLLLLFVVFGSYGCVAAVRFVWVSVIQDLLFPVFCVVLLVFVVVFWFLVLWVLIFCWVY